MRALMRAFDWAVSPVGPPATWPMSLTVTVKTLLTSRYPMVLVWGEHFTQFYNDAYSALIGDKHPAALGRDIRITLAEAWDTLGPMIAAVMASGEANWTPALLLLLERAGYREESYFSVSHAPAEDDDGRTAGMLAVCSEVTQQVLGERRTRLLRGLASGAAGTSSVRGVEQTCQDVIAALSGHSLDVPFALLYLGENVDGPLRLRGATGVDAADAPGELDPGGSDPGPGDKSAVPASPGGPLAAVAGSEDPASPSAGLQSPGLQEVGLVNANAPWRRALTGEVVTVQGWDFGVRGGPWGDPVREALLLPIATGPQGPPGLLVVGLSPNRALDEGYRSFFEVLAAQVSGALSTARALEDERRRADALADLDRAKTDFFSNVSHEFRTPLTLMLGPLDELLDDVQSLPPAARESLAMVRRNGLRLLRLVNRLLDFARIEAGRLQARFAPVDLAAFTADLTSPFREACARAGLCLNVDCAPLPGPAYVDRDAWEKIVVNLLANALKFTWQGGIDLRLTAVDGWAELTVADTGIGIPAEELPRVFERFRRVSGARGRTHEGSGIGLALVRELAALHGGEVTAESTPGAGSTFRVRLPLGCAHLPTAQMAEAPAESPQGAGMADHMAAADLAEVASLIDATAAAVAPAGPVGPVQEHPGMGRSGPDSFGPNVSGPEHVGPEHFWPASQEPARPGAGRGRVLLADDNADMRAYVRRLLAAEYEVEAVGDGHAALEALLARPFDLLLSDVMMPGLDGFGLLQAVRADLRLAGLPVVLLSARAGEGAAVEGLEARADDYLIKPFAARELLARVRTHLELGRARRDAQRAAGREAALTDANRRKEDFLAMLAHELRNPLGPLRNALHVLQLRDDADTVRRVRDLMDRQVQHLTRMVNDLLDWARVARGKVTLSVERLDLAALARDVAEDQRAAFAAARVELRVHAPATPLWVCGDAVRLTQVLANLLDNARKFTPAGGQVDLELTAAAGEAQLTVRDNGIGVEPELLPQLFESFVQADRSLDRAAGGLGMGLALVRGLVELHGGRVEAVSGGLGAGSEFRVILAREPEPAAWDAPFTPSAPTARPLSVLVVEDNRDAAESLRVLLELCGYAVTVAHDGDEGLAVARRLKPDVVLSDIGLPGMNGFEVAEALRRDPGTAGARLIAITGYGRDEDRARSRRAGFDYHLVKPIDPRALESILEQCSA